MTRVMGDSVTIANIPQTVDVVGCYDDGSFNNVAAAEARFPGKPILIFTVFARDDIGHCLDVENGDATPLQAPVWVSMRRQSGADPGVYCSLGKDGEIWAEVRGCFHAANVPEPWYIIAAYPGPGPVMIPGALGHQWIDHGLWDESIVADYIPGVDAAPPPLKGDDDMVTSWTEGTQNHVVRENLDGTLDHFWQDSNPNNPAIPAGEWQKERIKGS